MITVDGLTVEFGGTTLFKDISFQINEKDRIALMGKNGAGKSTLLKILAGVRPATRGTVSAPKDTVIAYLPQHLMTEDGRTVFEETCQAFAHLHETEAEINRINEELTVRTDYESDEYMALIEKVSALSEKFYAIDMTHFEEDVEKTLLGLGFERTDFDKPTSEFSGGWRMRIELAKLLLQRPEVLLLDEPTNHLDIESIRWLEQFLQRSSGAVILVSHDRAFINNVTNRTLEISCGKVVDYKVAYDEFVKQKARILDILDLLSSEYLLGDMGWTKKNYCNWGYRKNSKDLVILDYGHMLKIDPDKMICQDCGGFLHYNSTFTEIQCISCSKKTDFMNMKSRISKILSVLSEGPSSKVR